MSGRTLVLLLALTCGVTAAANCGATRPTLRGDVTATADALETLDDQLHDAKVDADTLRILHHFEAGLLELGEAVDAGADCNEVFETFQHFHDDLVLLYVTISQRHPEVLVRDNVLKAWNALMPVFLRLQRTVHGS